MWSPNILSPLGTIPEPQEWQSWDNGFRIPRGPQRSFYQTSRLFQIKSQTVTSSLNGTLSLFVTSWEDMALEALSAVWLESLEVLKIGLRFQVTLDTLMSLWTLSREFFSLFPFLGHQWPTEVWGWQKLLSSLFEWSCSSKTISFPYLVMWWPWPLTFDPQYFYA